VAATAGPLDGVRVIDFSTLLPGPLATLILAEAGAEVVKIERPGQGDELRGYEPKLGASSAGFALLNRGKRSLALDLKDPAAVAKLEPLLASAEVLVEQFRPGVMDRLGLAYDAVRQLNPKIVYSISGYGQSGPKAAVAGHDPNYMADTGLLALGGGDDGMPTIPPGLIADIGGGALPAVINVPLALRQAEATGGGCHLDVAMTDNLFAWQWWALGLLAAGRTPRPGGELLTGGSLRFQIYRTGDGRLLAAAPLEQRFWNTFCTLIDLPDDLRDDARDPAATQSAVAQIIASASAAPRSSARPTSCSTVRLRISRNKPGAPPGSCRARPADPRPPPAPWRARSRSRRSRGSDERSARPGTQSRRARGCAG